MLATLVAMEAPPVKAPNAGVLIRIEEVALASDDDAFAAVLLEEVYEPVLDTAEMNDTLAGAFKLDARIGHWQSEDPQAEALMLARELQAGFAF